MRIRPLIMLLTALAAVPTFAQLTPHSTSPQPITPTTADAHLSFAAATIKPHDPNDPCVNCSGFDSDGHRVKIQNKAVASIMQHAYGIHPHQIVDAPDWFFHETFDIVATTDTPGEPTLLQWEAAIQNLLADRFGLKFHREKRDLPAYALQIAKGGLKIKPARPDEEANGNDSRNGNDQTITSTSASMQDFTMRMQFMTDRPVIDQTGLTGKYDIALRYTIDESRTTDPSAPPGLFTAIEQQLGLKLQPTKAPVEVFVIDHVDYPSPN